MNDDAKALVQLAESLTQAQVEGVTAHMLATAAAIAPILAFLDMNNAHQESWDLQISLIEEGIRNPPPWKDTVTWSPIIDAWLRTHDAKLLLVQNGVKHYNQEGNLVTDQPAQLALFSADTPGISGQPHVPEQIRNDQAYALGQCDALRRRREGKSPTEQAVQDQIIRTISERDQVHALGYAASPRDNRHAYHAGKREPFLAEMRADYLDGWLSAWKENVHE
jgi:hypothetical protein